MPLVICDVNNAPPFKVGVRMKQDTIKDAFGTEVVVGDTVVFSDTVRKRVLVKAEVLRVMPKTIHVEYETQGWNGHEKGSSYLPSDRFMKVTE